MNDAKTFLLRVKLIDAHITNKLEELAVLRAMTTKITSTLKQDVVSGSGSQDRLGNAIAKIIDLETDINVSIDEYVDRKREIAGVLERMKDPDQINVLHKRYFENKQWEEIALEMHMSYRNVCYIHGRALQAVDAILRDASHETKTKKTL